VKLLVKLGGTLLDEEATRERLARQIAAVSRAASAATGAPRVQANGDGTAGSSAATNTVPTPMDFSGTRAAPTICSACLASGYRL